MHDLRKSKISTTIISRSLSESHIANQFYDQNIAIVHLLLLLIFQQSQDEAFPSEAQIFLEDQRGSHQLKESSRVSTFP